MEKEQPLPQRREVDLRPPAEIYFQQATPEVLHRYVQGYLLDATSQFVDRLNELGKQKTQEELLALSHLPQESEWVDVIIRNGDEHLRVIFQPRRMHDLINKRTPRKEGDLIIYKGKLDAGEMTDWNLIYGHEGAQWVCHEDAGIWEGEEQAALVFNRDSQELTTKQRELLNRVVLALSRASDNVESVSWKTRTYRPPQIGPIGGGGKRIAAVLWEPLTIPQGMVPALQPMPTPR